jgi:uncharacterized protein (TIGR02145 family)
MGSSTESTRQVAQPSFWFSVRCLQGLSQVKSSSSVSVISSSSSAGVNISSSSNLCVGFVNGTPRMHYGRNKQQFCDERDGQKYVYVTIGEGETAKTWMAENLNYAASGSICGNSTSCDIYGRLYNWNTAMNYSASSTTNVQGVCPAGWHLPSQVEWDVLGSNATELKAESGWYDNGNGTDDYGFSALPSSSGGGGYFGLWWTSSSDNGSIFAYGRRIDYGSNENVIRSLYDKSALYSVRCVKD